MEKIKGNKQLMEDLQIVYTQLRNGEISLKAAQGLSAVARTLSNAARNQLEYNKWTKSDGKIDFYEP